MNTHDMEAMLFGSTPDPHDKDSCLDDADARLQRAEQAWLDYLVGSPPPSELIALLKRINDELIPTVIDNLETTSAYLDMVGGGIEHLTLRADALEADLDAVLDLVEYLDDHGGAERRDRIRDLMARRPPQLALF